MNRSFPLTLGAARHALREMRAEPKPLQRPLLILGGYLDPGFAPPHLRKNMMRLTGDDRILALSFGFHYRFATCRDRTIAAVDQAFGGSDGADDVWTPEVDVIGFSMGGLVARYAAAQAQEQEDDETAGEQRQRRLRIARLFTISTPHRGATRASLPAITHLQQDMRIGSSFLAALVDALHEQPYPIIPYVRLRDWMIGEANAAPEGQNPWWVSCPAMEPSHAVAFRDPRILADIGRRLRDEPPYTRDPAQPLPG